MWEMRVRSLGWEDPLEKEITTHSSILAWEILWTEEPGGLQSMGSQSVGHDWSSWAQHSMFYETQQNTIPDCNLLSPVTLLVRGNPHITGIQFCVLRRNPSFQNRAKSRKAIPLNKHEFHKFVAPSHSMTIFLIVWPSYIIIRICKILWILNSS